MRSRDINFNVTGMKPNSRVYAFFDGVDVNADVKPIGNSSSDTTISSPFAKADTTLTVNSTTGFPTTGTLGVGDTTEVDPFGVGFIKQEQMTYTVRQQLPSQALLVTLVISMMRHRTGTQLHL